MTRRERREYLVAIGCASVVGLILMIVFLRAGADGIPARSEFSTSVQDVDTKLPSALGLTAWLPTPELPAAARASASPPPFTEGDRQTFPSPTTMGGDITAQTPGLAPSEPTEPSAPAAGGSHDSALLVPDHITSSTGRRPAAGATGGFAPGLPTGRAGQGPAVTEDSAEPARGEVPSQTARASGARHSITQTAGDAVAPSSEMPASALATPGGSLAPRVLEELVVSSPVLDPIVVGSLEAVGESAFEAVYRDVFDEPAQLDALVLSAANELTALFEVPDADSGTLPAAATSSSANRIVNPEPATLLLLGTGLGLAARYARRPRQPQGR